MVLKAAFAMLAAGMPMQYASANGNVAPNALTQAQGSVVQGTVKDGTGEPLIGVSVVVKGATGLGVVTDIDGNYKINVKDKNAVLVFSYIGYTPQEVKIGGRSSVDVTMKDESSVLKEVVVTAMGIKRKESSLTYSTQQVKASDLNRVQDPNVANSLEGKVSGVTITPSAGGAGGASKIILRGNKSILGSSTPLIVVDGVPMNNSQRGQVGSGANMLTTGVSEGSDALSMINPDDIESINVLKGANAAALYGSEAANGVLMITTKKGREGKVGVNFSSNVTFDTPLTTPKIQNVYGAAIDENAHTMSISSWGNKLSSRANDQLIIQTPMAGEHFGTAMNEVHLRNSAKDDVADFFKTGVTTNNSIALSGGTDKMSSYFSYGNSHSNGMIENNSYNRHTFSFRQNFKLYDRATIDVSMNYIQTKTKNRPGGGITMNPIYHLYMMPRNIDLNYYRNNYRVDNGSWMTGLQTYFQRTSKYMPVLDEQGNQKMDDQGLPMYQSVLAYDKVTERGQVTGQPMQNWAYSAAGQNNPYWLINQNSSVAKEDRFFGNITGSLDIYDGLSFQARLGMDFTKYESESKRYATTWLPASMEDLGRYWWSYSKTTDLYTDFMLNYNKTFGDWDVSATAGYVGHIRKSFGHSNDVTATYYYGDREHLSTMANYFSTAAGGPGATSPSQSSDWNKGAVVTGQIGWKEMVYFDGSYRRDWYRAFRQFKDRGTPEDYGYFGFGANAIVSNIVKMPEWFNYLKYRASYSEVGNSIPGIVYAGGSRNFQTGALTPSSWATFKNPRPEKTASFETGFEALFLKNRLSLDVTYYNSTMSNLYLVGTNASGKSIPMNSAKIRNQGIEATVGYDFKFGQLRWKTSYNLSYNDNKILRTAYDEKTGKENVIATYVGGVQVLYKEGGSMGDMYVTDIKRDENGHYVLNAKGGLSMETESSKTYGKYVGNQNAKWQMGWSNTFTWKDLSLSFLINGRIGGKVLSMTESFLDGAGLSQRTADARLYAEKNNIYADAIYGNNILGIKLDDGSGRIVPIESYYNSVGGVTPQDIERYLYSGTNFRLRELSLGYTFRNLFGQNKNLSLSFIARNLFFLYKDAPVDPDVSLSTGTGLGAFEVFNMPSSRSFGFSLNVNF